MNTLVIVLIAAVVLFGAYVFYGRWLANKWGIDSKAKTPAVEFNDGKDFVPTNGWTVFSHQFSSIAGAGPVTGAIQAAAFGWLPVLLWVLIGGVFFGAVTDFGALYASVKNKGKSMGMLIEKYIGKTGRKLFLIFSWIFCCIVVAAFADMVAGTFNAYTVTDAGVTELAATATTNGAAGMISIMFMVFAVVLGLIQKKFNLTGWKEAVVGIVCIVASFAIGMNCPLIFGKAAWSYITFVYIFFAAVLPMWLLKQPRDYMTTFMFICMIAGAVVGLVVAHPTMNLPVFTGFTNEKLGTMFPMHAVRFPVSTVWFPRVRPPRPSRTKRTCPRLAMAQWCWKACWLFWHCALPVLLQQLTVRRQRARRSRYSAAVSQASSRCSAFRFMLLLHL